MDKKTILGVAVMALFFIGFAFISSKQQKEYQEKLAAWQAQQDSIALAANPQAEASAEEVSAAAGAPQEAALAEEGSEAALDAAAAARARRVALLGE